MAINLVFGVEEVDVAGGADGLAQLFADLGCKAAYNLDGGASAVMTFNDEIYSRPSNGGRALGDALLIKELDGTGEGDA